MILDVAAVRTFFVNPLVNGLILGLLVIGVFISFRVLNVADLSVEGVLPMLTLLTAAFLKSGLDPWLTLLICALIGAACGAVNALLTLYLKTPPLLSGIIVMALCFGIGIAINSLNAGQVNFDPSKTRTAFNWLQSLLRFSNENNVWNVFYASYLSYILVGGLILLAVWFLLYFFFGTELGVSIRAAGKNPTMAESNGINVKAMNIIALSLSGAIIGLASSLYGQHNAMGLPTDGQGMIVIALSSLFLGEMVVGTRTFKRAMLSALVGSLLYWYVIQLLMTIDSTGYMLSVYKALLLVVIITLQFLIAKIKKATKKPKAPKESGGKSENVSPVDSFKQSFMRHCLGERTVC